MIDFHQVFANITIGLAMVSLFDEVAAAPIYKCKGKDGNLTYQEVPCGSKKQPAAARVTPPPPTPATPAVEAESALFVPSGKAKETDTDKAMQAAFNARMNRGDFAGAAAFATTEEQKQYAKRMQAEKDQRCSNMQMDVRHARYTAKNSRSPIFQEKAEAAEARYIAACR
ncbi:MAG: DUF4124 domain-containing protein [Burkholderiales bacterium]